MGSESSYKKVFIVGCPRSGTTWLKKMLASHKCVIPVRNESHIYRLVYEPFTYIPKLSSQKRWERWRYFVQHYGLRALLFGANTSDIWNSILRSYQIYQKNNDVGLHHLISYPKLKNLITEVNKQSATDLEKAQALIHLILDSFFEQAGGESDHIFIEKTPFHIKYTDVILEGFPEAKVINIVRDGRDVCASLQARAKNKRWASYDTKTIISQWEKCIHLSEKFLAEPTLKDRFYSVKYEAIRENTPFEIKRICDFIGLTVPPEELSQMIASCNIENIKNKGVGQHVNQGSVNSWKDILPQEQIELWHQSVGETLTRLGYSIAI
ncbi:MAG: sulfotransferase [Leptolyngbya sp. SIO3F4]|nr:sulfotransferase [Leptolyngbya sp. SIO3F4]